ncbi:MAG: riboflavin biosynthesis protein RibD [Gemmatimonadetes bacterium]|nr:riboflavin biosynthesis protein RibD [Gemmatimonadota bacterium]
MSQATRAVEADLRFLRRAVVLAARGWGQAAPNPMVGAVVVREGVVVGEGWHTRYGNAHAEVEALARAGEAARGAYAYVSLEPCNHHGKQPPCTAALIAAGVARVIVAARDPNPKASGGIERLRQAGVRVDVIELPEAHEINAPFFHAFAGHERPFITLKLALSSEGAVAMPGDERRWLSGPESRAEVHRQRADADAVAVGIGTALADDPELTVRDAPPPRVPPTRVVFDRAARLPPGSRLARTARDLPVLVLAETPDPQGRAALEALGVTVLASSGLPGALRALRDRGIRHLYVEGGARLARALLDAAVVDRLVIFQSSVTLGQGALSPFPGDWPEWAARLPVVAQATFGGDEMTIYDLERARCSPAS